MSLNRTSQTLGSRSPPTPFSTASGTRLPCGSVEELADALLSDHLNAWSASHSFRLKNTAVELKGLCAACAR